MLQPIFSANNQLTHLQCTITFSTLRALIKSITKQISSFWIAIEIRKLSMNDDSPEHDRWQRVTVCRALDFGLGVDGHGHIGHIQNLRFDEHNHVHKPLDLTSRVAGHVLELTVVRATDPVQAQHTRQLVHGVPLGALAQVPLVRHVYPCHRGFWFTVGRATHAGHLALNHFQLGNLVGNKRWRFVNLCKKRKCHNL